MKPVKSCALVILCLGLATATMQAKDLEWKPGKLIEVKNEKAQASAGTVVSRRGDLWDYTVDDGKAIYVMQVDLRVHGDGPIFVTPNTLVKFAIEKHKAYLIDDDGKQHKLALVSKSDKAPPVQPKAPAAPANQAKAPVTPDANQAKAPVTPDANQAKAQSVSDADPKQ